MAASTADILARGAGAYFLALEVRVGTTLKRWATSDVDADVGPFEGRLIGDPVLTREIARGGPVLGDVSIAVDNTDGDLNSLLNDLSDTSSNLYRATILVLRGAVGVARASWEVRGVYQSALVESENEDGTVSLRLLERRDQLFGSLSPPSYGAVADIMELERGASEFIEFQRGYQRWDRRCPYIFGFFGGFRGRNDYDFDDAIEGQRVGYGTFNFDAAGQVTGHLYLFGLNQDGFGTLRDRVYVRDEATAGVSQLNVSGAVYDLAVTTYGLNVLAVVIESDLNSDLDLALWAGLSVFISADGGGGFSYNPVGLIEELVSVYAERRRPLASPFVDTTSFANAKRATEGTRIRLIVDREIPAMQAIQECAQSGYIDPFYKADGSLGLLALSPEGGANPTYSSTTSLFRHGSVVAARSMRQVDGDRHGLVTSATVRYRPKLRGTGDSVTYEDTDASRRHGRVAELEGGIDAPLVPDELSASDIARRAVALNSEGRRVYEVEVAIGGNTDLDLGDVVRFTHATVPAGGVTLKPCVVERIIEARDTLTLTLVPYGVLSDKVYLLGDQSAAVRITGGGGLGIDMTSGSATVTPSGWNVGVLGLEVKDALAVNGDLLGNAANNNLVTLVKTVDTGGNTFTLYDPSTDGEKWGSGLPDANATNETNFKIYKTHTTLAAGVAKHGRLCDTGQTTPGAREGHTFVRTGNDEGYLFGGHDGSSYLSDVWKWDGASATRSPWAEVSTSGGPPAARKYHASWYDRTNDSLYVHGGYDGSTYRSDTWRLNLSTNAWTDMSPAGVAGTDYPEGRQRHTVTLEPDEGERAILFGGQDGSTGYSDTWRWDPNGGGSWTELTPAANPSERHGHTAASGAQSTDLIHLFGGRAHGATTANAELWTWTGTNWSQLSPSTTPTTLWAASSDMLDHNDSRYFVVYGGTTGDTAGADDYRAETWAYVIEAGLNDVGGPEGDWMRMGGPTFRPRPRRDHAMAAAGGSAAGAGGGGAQYLVLFGGTLFDASLDDGYWWLEPGRDWVEVLIQGAGTLSDGAAGYKQGLPG